MTKTVRDTEEKKNKTNRVNVICVQKSVTETVSVCSSVCVSCECEQSRCFLSQQFSNFRQQDAQ